MKPRLKIGIDMDGVVYDFVTAFRREAEELLGRSFPIFSTGWHFDNWEINPTEEAKVWERVYNTENWFWRKEETFAEAAEALRYNINAYETYFITTRIQTLGIPVQNQTQNQLHAIGVEFPTVIVLPDKGPISNILELDAFVDDRVENLQRIQQCSPETKLYLMNQEYNRQFAAPKEWTRIYSLSEFFRKLEENKYVDSAD